MPGGIGDTFFAASVPNALRCGLRPALDGPRDPPPPSRPRRRRDAVPLMHDMDEKTIQRIATASLRSLCEVRAFAAVSQPPAPIRGLSPRPTGLCAPGRGRRRGRLPLSRHEGGACSIPRWHADVARPLMPNPAVRGRRHRLHRRHQRAAPCSAQPRQGARRWCVCRRRAHPRLAPPAAQATRVEEDLRRLNVPAHCVRVVVDALKRGRGELQGAAMDGRLRFPHLTSCDWCAVALCVPTARPAHLTAAPTPAGAAT